MSAPFKRRDQQAHEKAIIARTLAENSAEVRLCERLLNHLMDGFNSLGRFTWEEPSGTILLLATMGQNSLRWAWELLHKGYYTQANALSRTGWECWLHGAYLLLYPGELENWRDFQLRPKPREMRRLVAQRSAQLDAVDAYELRIGMDRWYREYSEYIHPSDISLRVLVADRDGETRLCLLGEYDGLLMMHSTDMFCNAAVMLATLLYVLLPEMTDYRGRGDSLREDLAGWRRGVRA